MYVGFGQQGRAERERERESGGERERERERERVTSKASLCGGIDDKPSKLWQGMLTYVPEHRENEGWQGWVGGVGR